MKSKGGKIEYCCAECNSQDIMKVRTVLREQSDGCIFVHGIYNTVDDLYYCGRCGESDGWNKKLKIPLKGVMPELRYTTPLSSKPDDYQFKKVTVYAGNKSRMLNGLIYQKYKA